HERVHGNHWEHTADARARKLRYLTCRPSERRRIEPERVLRLASLEVIRVAAAQVEYRAAAQDVNPVADEGIVRADKRQLSVLRRPGPDRGDVAHLVARVLAPAEKRPILGSEVLVDFSDPVPELVLVE